MSSDYELHDWKTILERKVQVSDGVFLYPCVYADIMLTDDLEFYDAIPKQPIHKDLYNNMLTDEEKLVVSVLKEYIMSSDYELHDWKKILERRTKVKEDVYSYPCVYADIMLTDDLEFYDAVTKQPIHGFHENWLDDEQKLIVSVLKGYIPYKYRSDVDWEAVLSRREEIKPNVYKYNVNGVEFCLDDDLNPVEYGNVHIIDDKIYYDIGLNPEVEYAPLMFFSEV